MRKACAAAGLLIACGGGEGITGTKTGNPDQKNPNAELQLEMRAWSSDPAIVGLPEPQALATGTTIHRAILGVEEIRLIDTIADGSCSGAFEGPEIEREFTVDLLGGEALAPVTVAKSKRFCGFRIRLAEGRQLEGSEHAALLGDAAILIEGTRADGTPFQLRSDGVRDIRLRSTRAFSFADDRALWFLAFDAARWFAQLDLDGAEVEQDGTIYIDGYENYGLLVQFESTAERAVASCKDDDDGAFGDECRDPFLGDPPPAD